MSYCIVHIVKRIIFSTVLCVYFSVTYWDCLAYPGCANSHPFQGILLQKPSTLTVSSLISKKLLFLSI